MSKCPCTGVGILSSTRRIPRVQVRIGRRLFQLMRKNRDRSIDARIIIRTRALGSTRSNAPFRVSHKGITDLSVSEIADSMPTAILRAESGASRHVRGSEQEIDSVRIIRQPVTRDRIVNDGPDIRIGQTRLGARIGCFASEQDRTGNRASVRRIQIEVRCISDAVRPIANQLLPSRSIGPI